MSGGTAAGPLLAPWIAGALVGAVGAVGVGLSGLRFLRVAQREHYEPGRVTRFAWRWWRSGRNPALGLAAVAAVGASARWWPAMFAAAAAVAIGPLGLGLRGRTAPLRFTRRLSTLAAVAALPEAGLLVAGGLLGAERHLAAGAVVAGCGLLAVPLAVELAAAVLTPVERRLADRYVASARAKLDRIRPVVVGVTGSFGKTTTKGYIAHLVGGARSAVASPQSFNNRMGLARAVNEHLPLGTEVFVAEMGTYGRGEIAELCSWLRPKVSVITAIGPVHLERFGSEDAILEAKSEILEGAEAAVLNVDDARLRALAARLSEEHRRVWRCASVEADADVRVTRSGGDCGLGGLVVTVAGRTLGTLERVDVAPTNLACAVACALELGVPEPVVAERLRSVAPAPARLASFEAEAGFLVLDDTYNSNPAGAAFALEVLRTLGRPEGRRVVVTPGMVELGRRQAAENAAFGAAAASVATDVVIVGRTNRRALLAGVARAATAPRVHLVRTRDEAVRLVRSLVGPGDAVLYENDLPDHFP